MEISDSRKCNLMNLAKVEGFLDVPSGMLRNYYEELLEDNFFIEEINRTIAEVKRKSGFNNGRALWLKYAKPEKILLYGNSWCIFYKKLTTAKLHLRFYPISAKSNRD